MGVVAAVFLVAGLALMVAAVLPAALARLPISAPIVLVTLGALVGAVPMRERWADPMAHTVFVTHLAEICVLVSLVGVGLAIDRPLRWRSWRAPWPAG